MNTFHLTIASPDGALFKGDAEMLSVRGIEGDLAVLAGHIPFITALKPGKISVDLSEEERRTAYAEDGLLTVGADGVRLLSGTFRWTEEEN